jgi:FKBP-type peptidyl-prolyl cis-trans isomerase FklB
MKINTAGLAALCLILASSLAQAEVSVKTDKEKLSYSLGYQFGQNAKRNDLDLDTNVFAAAIRDAVSDAKPALTDDEMRAVVQDFQQKLQQKMMAQMQEQASKNKKDGDAFQAKNKKDKGVVTLQSGLQYKVIKAGTGKKPTPADTVTAHYSGKLINGTEFDSSYKRGEPATFPLNGVIRGWQEALPLMQEGAKWQVVIPPELGYGPNGAGQTIGPNETLIFEIELIAVKAGGPN